MERRYAESDVKCLSGIIMYGTVEDGAKNPYALDSLIGLDENLGERYRQTRLLVKRILAIGSSGETKGVGASEGFPTAFSFSPCDNEPWSGTLPTLALFLSKITV